MKRLSEPYFAFIPLLLLCALFIWQALEAPVHDFANYYFGGHFWGANQFTSEIYFPYWFNQQIIALGHPPVFAGFAPNTPFLAMLFYPLTLLDVMTAKLVFNSVSVLLFLYSLKRLVAFYGINPIYILLIPVLFLIPIRNEIMFGQVYLLLFFLLAESWLTYEKGQHWKTAIFFSAAILLKVFPILLLLLFVFRKEFKLLCYTLIACSVFILPTLLFCSVETWVFYITDVLGKASKGEIASAYVANYQSVFMFVKQLLLFDETENPGGLLSNPLWFLATMFMIKAAIVGIGWYVSKKAASTLFVFAFWITACMILSPYGSTYTFILMLFPFFAIAKTAMPKWKAATMALLLFFICNLPLSLFIERIFPVSYLRLFLLMAFSILLTALYRRLIGWKIISAISLIAFAGFLALSSSEEKKPKYLLRKDSPLLVYDYSIDGDKLTYFYWDGNGEHATTLPMGIATVIPADLTRNAIYFYGRKIVSDQSHKLKPVVINGKTLIYLSDLNRGIGFYTIRKIDLR